MVTSTTVPLVPSPDVVEAALSVLSPTAGPQTVGAAVSRSIRDVAVKSDDISQTLDAVARAFSVFDTGPEAGWGSYGLIGLPVAAGVRTMTSLASQYLDQQTDLSLAGWVETVNTCSTQFDAYGEQLRRTDATLAAAREAGSPHDDAVARVSLDAVKVLRDDTVVWRLILVRVKQLGRVVDAVVRAGQDTPVEGNDERVEVDDTPPETASGSQTGGRSRLGGLADRVSDKAGGWGDMAQQVRELSKVLGRMTRPAGGMVEWAMRPFTDVKERAERLPTQVAALADDVDLLEVLLDLHASSLLAELGELSGPDPTVAGARMAASAWLPEFSHELSAAHRRADESAATLARLESAHAAQEISPAAHAALATEYRAEHDRLTARLGELKQQSQLWRESGPILVDASEAWVRHQIDLLNARAIAEAAQIDEAHRRPLERELRRVDEARELLRSR